MTVDVAPGRLVPIRSSDLTAALDEMWAVRNAGGVPLIGDNRWDDQYWARLVRIAEDSPLLPHVAWASFSSGSSGAPRVILRNDASWSMSFAPIGELLELRGSDVILLPAPPASSLSLFSVAHARATGASIRFSRGHALTAGDLDGATLTHCTPTALAAIVEAIETGAPHTLRAALVGGAHLDESLRRRAATLGLRVISYYGAAELSFVAVDLDGSGLLPFPGVEVRLTDGELWVRSPYIAVGYLDEAKGALRRDDHWATVGDRAELDDAGRIRLRGRSDGAILTAAATVVPGDVEAALRTIEGISDAVVFAIPYSAGDSLVGVVIEIAPDAPALRLRDLRAQAETLLSTSHRPRRWFWTDSLERTVSGKPARVNIRNDALAGKVARLD